MRGAIEERAQQKIARMRRIYDALAIGCTLEEIAKHQGFTMPALHQHLALLRGYLWQTIRVELRSREDLINYAKQHPRAR
jgi:hypothetical protein